MRQVPPGEGRYSFTQRSGSVTAVRLAAHQAADIHAVAFEPAARVNRDPAAGSRRVGDVLGERKLVEMDGRPGRAPARGGHA